MTTASHDFVPLRSAVTGPVVGPDDDGWDAARQAWNLTADLHPAAVAFADSAGDVAAVVNFARERGLQVAAQGTGHGAGALGRPRAGRTERSDCGKQGARRSNTGNKATGGRLRDPRRPSR